MATNTDLLALQAIIKGLRTLLTRKDSSAERLESAGRLLIEAMSAGAFGGCEYAHFRAMVRQRLEQPPPANGWISAWSEAVWLLRDMPDHPQDLMASIASDVELVIRVMNDSVSKQANDRRQPEAEGGGSPFDILHDPVEVAWVAKQVPKSGGGGRSDKLADRLKRDGRPLVKHRNKWWCQRADAKRMIAPRYRKNLDPTDEDGE